MPAMIKTPLGFSDYIIFADESSDHGLRSINPENPVFVLALCIFKKSDYISIVKQAVAQFKIDFWGHDLVILHNHAIRKSTGDFSSLFNEEQRRMFLHALNEMIKSLPFSIAATVVDKRYLNSRPSPQQSLSFSFGIVPGAGLQFFRGKETAAALNPFHR